MTKVTAKRSVIIALICVMFTLFVSTYAQNYTPEQIRLELTGVDTQMNIIYTTGSTSDSDYKIYTSTPKPQAWIGTSASALTKKITGEVKRYEYDQYRADIHVVTLTGLTAGTKYYYKVGNSQ
eukprot:UN09451